MSTRCVVKCLLLADIQCGTTVFLLYCYTFMSPFSFSLLQGGNSTSTATALVSCHLMSSLCLWAISNTADCTRISSSSISSCTAMTNVPRIFLHSPMPAFCLSVCSHWQACSVWFGCLCRLPLPLPSPTAGRHQCCCCCADSICLFYPSFSFSTACSWNDAPVLQCAAKRQWQSVRSDDRRRRTVKAADSADTAAKLTNKILARHIKTWYHFLLSILCPPIHLQRNNFASLQHILSTDPLPLRLFAL